MKVMLVMVLVGVCLWGRGGPAHAADETLSDTLVDALYGGAIGALVGTAAMALTSHPKDHLSYIATGAGIGVIAGTVYGLSRAAARSFVEIDRGRVAWRMPTVVASLEADPRGGWGSRYTAALLRYRF